MGVKVDLSSLRKLDERLSTKEQRREVDLLTAQGFTFYEGHTPFDDKQETLPLQSSEPPRSDSAPQAKESKPSSLQASEAATRPQRKPLLDSTGTIDYSKLERENHEFLARHNPPPIDAAYYAGCTSCEQLMTTRSPAEIAYWEQVEADRDAILLRHNNNGFIAGLLAASWDALTKDYERLLLECLKDKLNALDQQPETACKE